jgi:hypothetical protein
LWALLPARTDFYVHRVQVGAKKHFVLSAPAKSARASATADVLFILFIFLLVFRF